MFNLHIGSKKKNKANNKKNNETISTLTPTNNMINSAKKIEDNKNIETKQDAQSKNNPLNIKRTNIAFNILAIFCIVIFCMAITPKTFQNDTYYTIKLGEYVRANGIDFQDHFSWIENLPYMYPHWLYDVFTSILYDSFGGFSAIYIATMAFSAILGVALYVTSKKVCKNRVIAFVMTIGQMYLMKDYITARAQLVTFGLFVLTILFIEKFLEKPKKRYAVALIIIPILIANIHSAVFPFYFVLYLPYIAEYIIAVILDWHLVHKIEKWWIKQNINDINNKLKKASNEKIKEYQVKLAKYNSIDEKCDKKFESFLVKQKDRRKNPYKLKIERNDNVRWLIIIMIICGFTGLLTPIKDMPYTYTWRIMQGNTTSKINEHLPLTLINNKPILYSLTAFIALLAFTKIKIRARDLFMIGGLTLLALMTRRQVSMLTLFGGIIIARILSELIEKYDLNGTQELINYMTSALGELLTILLVFAISYSIYKPQINDKYVDSNSYPVEACDWIKENLDYKNIKIFNDYNYGSYMMFEDIPVFIDSRCDLYTPEFNGTYNKEKRKFEGQDIFTDYLNISDLATYYQGKFDEYKITHVITKSNSRLNMLLSRDSKYKELYKDSKFIIYEIQKD